MKHSLRFFWPLACAALLGLGLAAVWADPEAKTSASGSPAAGHSSVVPGKTPPLEKIPARITADHVGYDHAHGTVELSGHVLIDNNETQIFCDEAQFETGPQIVHCKGQVLTYQEQRLYVGENTVYDFKNRQGSSRNFRALNLPLYFTGKSVRQEGPDLLIVERGTLSTCDAQHPHYWLSAKTIDIIPSEKAVAHSVTFWVHGVPVFWWPRITDYFDQDRPQIHVTPGHSSSDGYFLLTGYSPRLPRYGDLRIRPTINLDYRSKRGWGGGVDGKIDDPGEGLVKSSFTTYAMNDRDYVPILGLADKNDPNRYWLNINHQQPAFWDLTLSVGVDVASDADIVYEFFRDDYQKANQRTNYVDLSRTIGLFYLDIYTEYQVNSFDTVIERLPQVKLNEWSTPLGETGVYYTSSSSVARLRRMPSDVEERNRELQIQAVAASATPLALPPPIFYSADRFDSLHELSYAHKFFGWLNVEPWMGVEYTHFSDSQNGNPLDRMIYNPGITFSTKFYRAFDSVHSEALDIEKLRHVVQPYITYDYIPEPNVRPSQLWQFDNIDSIDKKNHFEIGVRNLLETKRRNEADTDERLMTLDLVDSNLYTYWYPVITEPAMPDNTFNRRFGYIFMDNTFQLRRWLQLQINPRYNPYKHTLDSLVANLLAYQDEQWAVSLGYQYLRDNTDYITGTGSYALTRNWSVKLEEMYDARAGLLQEQTLTLHRDLHCWDVSLCYDFRKNVNLRGRDDQSYYVMLGLKEFTKSPVRTKF